MTETPAQAFGPAVTVPAADLHALICAFAQVDQSFHPFLGIIPGHAEAREACGRLASVLVHSPSVAGLPPDPVGTVDAGAIAHHELLSSYERAGFTHDEAFQVLLTLMRGAVAAQGHS